MGASMRFTYTEGHFSTEDEAFAEIAARGWYAIPADVVGKERQHSD